MIKIDSMLLIGSTTKDAGKTTLACRIIDKFKEKLKTIALKIAVTNTLPQYSLTQENNPDSRTDSGKMLAAGAAKSFYLKTAENMLDEAFTEFLGKTKPAVIICESTSLARFAQPGLFIMIKANKDDIKKSALAVMKKADIIIDSKRCLSDFDISKIEFADNKWQIK